MIIGDLNSRLENVGLMIHLKNLHLSINQANNYRKYMERNLSNYGKLIVAMGLVKQISYVNIKR